MTSPSDNIDTQKVCRTVNAALDDSVAQMSHQATSDLYRVRQAALHAGKRPRTDAGTEKRLMTTLKMAVPVACVAVLALTWHQGTIETPQALPTAMITEDVPSEDLSLLEDLEFVAWLAENEQDALL